MQRLDDFMAQALSAYYDTHDPFGVDGDFTTAPEISQLFGEIIGVWAVQKWMQMGAPSSFNLIEIGPGRGTLMADLLRGIQHVSAFHNATTIHLVETSVSLKSKQQNTLKKHDVSWHCHLNEIPNDIPAIIIGNEFFDALPVRQFKYNDGQWFEHYIDGDKFEWIQVDDIPWKSTLPPPQNDDVFEYSKTQEDYATLLKSYHGAMLFIDYGYEKSTYGDSLQALYKHQHCAITDHIGQADLTSHIDFEWLSSFFCTTRVISQSQFLQENGIAIRYHQLNNPKLQSGYERLIHPDQMGNLFKVLEVNRLDS